MSGIELITPDSGAYVPVTDPAATKSYTVKNNGVPGAAADVGLIFDKAVAPATTTIAAGSNGAALPQATINVASTTGFALAGDGSGQISVASSAGTQIVNFTGTTATTFTGCTGGTGTLSTGGAVQGSGDPSFSTTFHFSINGTSKWDTGMDTKDYEYAAVFHYGADGGPSGDFFRFAPDGRAIIGPGVGTPTVWNAQFTIRNLAIGGKVQNCGLYIDGANATPGGDGIQVNLKGDAFGLAIYQAAATKRSKITLTNGQAFQFGTDLNSANVADFWLWKDAGAATGLKFYISDGGGFYFGNAVLATTATDGFVNIPTCAGAPTGVPTTRTGSLPMVYDTTNNKFWIYNGAWKGVALA